jgi:KDO2-lipid IV(A) lauroyltransferase
MATVLRPFGWRAASRAGAFIGGLIWRPLGIRADRVQRAIAAAFPDFSPARVREVARASYRGLGTMAFETIILSRLGREELLAAFADPDGWPLLEAAAKKGQGVVIVAGHMGNWELCAAYMAARGLPLDVITMHMANPLADGFLRRTRERLGARVVFDDEAVRITPRALKEGRAVGFMSDQGAKGLASTFVDFFGRPAKTPGTLEHRAAIAVAGTAWRLCALAVRLTAKERLIPGRAGGGGARAGRGCRRRARSALRAGRGTRACRAGG